jgi:hypothetical protein
VLLATCGPTFLLHAFTKSYIITLKASPRDQDGTCLISASLVCSSSCRSHVHARRLRVL